MKNNHYIIKHHHDKMPTNIPLPTVSSNASVRQRSGSSNGKVAGPNAALSPSCEALHWSLKSMKIHDIIKYMSNISKISSKMLGYVVFVHFYYLGSVFSKSRTWLLRHRLWWKPRSLLGWRCLQDVSSTRFPSCCSLRFPTLRMVTSHKTSKMIHFHMYAKLKTWPRGHNRRMRCLPL